MVSRVAVGMKTNDASENRARCSAEGIAAEFLRASGAAA